LGIVSFCDVPLVLLSDFDEVAGFPSRPGGFEDLVELQPVISREAAATSAARERRSRGILGFGILDSRFWISGSGWGGCLGGNPKSPIRFRCGNIL
jgi:hypothetical protein